MTEFEKQFTKKVGKEVKKMMLDADVKNKDIAQLFNVTTACISQMLNGKRPLSLFKAKLICTKCNVKLFTLFERAGL